MNLSTNNTINERKTYSLMDSLSGILAILLFLTIFFENNILSIMVTSLIVLVGLTDYKRLFPTFFLVSLAGDTFSSFVGVGYPRIYVVAFAISFLLSFVSTHKTIKMKHLILLLLVVLTTIISNTKSLTNSTTNLFTIILNVIVVIIFMNTVVDRDELKIIFERTYIVMVSFVIMYALVLLIDPYIYHRGFKVCYVISSKNNPNAYAQMLAQIGAFLFSYFLIKRNENRRAIFNLIAIVITFVELYLTKAVGGLYAFAFGMLVIFIIFHKQNEKFSTRSKTILFLITLLLGVIGICLLLFPSIMDSSSFISAIQNGGNGRLDYITAELKYIIPKNWAFGVGIGTPNEVAALNPYFPRGSMSSTNIVFSMLTQIGIVGFIIYVVFFGRILKEGYWTIKNEIYTLIPVAMMINALFNGIGEVVFFERYFWNSMALICMISLNFGCRNYRERMGL